MRRLVARKSCDARHLEILYRPCVGSNEYLQRLENLGYWCMLGYWCRPSISLLSLCDVWPSVLPCMAKRAGHAAWKSTDKGYRPGRGPSGEETWWGRIDELVRGSGHARSLQDCVAPRLAPLQIGCSHVLPWRMLLLDVAAVPLSRALLKMRRYGGRWLDNAGKVAQIRYPDLLQHLRNDDSHEPQAGGRNLVITQPVSSDRWHWGRHLIGTLDDADAPLPLGTAF
eukprot:2939521-Amphidinium_carterae.1